MNSEYIHSFWRWVQEMCNDIGTANPLPALVAHPEVFAELQRELGYVDHDLSAKVIQEVPSDPSSLALVISPSGHPDLLSLAQDVASASPFHDLFHTIACIPRSNTPPLAVVIDGQEIQLDKFTFQLVEGRGLVNLTIGIPGYQYGNDEEYNEVIFRLLDLLLGERDVITKVGDIMFVPLALVDGAAQPTLPSLPAAFDSFATTMTESIRARQNMPLNDRVAENFKKCRSKIANELGLALENSDDGARISVCEIVFLGNSPDAAREIEVILQQKLGGISEITPIYTIVGPSLTLSHSFPLQSLDGNALFRTINEVAFSAGERAFDLCDVQVASR
jgi:hypothetical protein